MGEQDSTNTGEQDRKNRPFPWWILSVVAAFAVLALLVTHRPAATTTVSSVSARTAAAHSRRVHKPLAPRAAHTPSTATTIATPPAEVHPKAVVVSSLPGPTAPATVAPATVAPATVAPTPVAPAAVTPTTVAPAAVAPLASAPRELPHTD